MLCDLPYRKLLLCQLALRWNKSQEHFLVRCFRRCRQVPAQRPKALPKLQRYRKVQNQILREAHLCNQQQLCLQLRDPKYLHPDDQQLPAVLDHADSERSQLHQLLLCLPQIDLLPHGSMVRLKQGAPTFHCVMRKLIIREAWLSHLWQPK